MICIITGNSVKINSMNKKNWVTILLGIGALVACNNNKPEKESVTPSGEKETMVHATTVSDSAIQTVTVMFTGLNPAVAGVIKEIADHYFEIKNALAADNGNGAAAGGKAMVKSMNTLDKSLFTAEQKKVYETIGEDLIEHAEHIGKNGDDIGHQRDHFSMMSESMYDLVKAFDVGRTVYHDHCPMYKEEKGGAMWLSETKEIHNPYFGAEMPVCGTVKERIGN